MLRLVCSVVELSTSIFHHDDVLEPGKQARLRTVGVQLYRCCRMLRVTNTNFGSKAARSWKGHQTHARSHVRTSTCMRIALQGPPHLNALAEGESGPGRCEGSRGVG
eukprot:14481453-Alexandrium_andersonii.AAC.1